MELQVALDFVDVKRALEVLREIQDFVDIVEVGTPLIIKEGINAVSEIKSHFPGKTVLADLKIVDAGEYETLLAIEHGADIVTVLGAANDSTILKALHAAHSLGKEVMVDLIGARDLGIICGKLEQLGVDIICVHTPFDLQPTSMDSLGDLLCVKSSLKKRAPIRVAVAGGISLQNLDLVLRHRPDIVIVGSGIIGALDMREAALEIHRRVGQGGESLE
jgi:3-hexulose-6-phosphate synthase